MSPTWRCAIAARRCGSLALADPSAEMPAVAVALNADIVLRKRGATRTVAARDFFQGLYQTARNDDEMIAEVDVSGGEARTRCSAFPS